MKIRKSILSILLVLCMFTQVFPSNLSILSAEEPADNDTEFVLEEDTSAEITEVVPEEVFFEETEVTEENTISVEEISEKVEILEESNIVEEESSEEVLEAEEISEAIETPAFTEDMTQRMVLVDKWTLIMVIMLAVNALAAYFTRNRKEEKEEQEEARA